MNELITQLPEWLQTFAALVVSAGVTSYAFVLAQRRGRPKEEREPFRLEKAGVTFAVAFVLTLVLSGLGIATNQAEIIPLLALFAGPIAVSVQKVIKEYQRTGVVDTDPLTATLESLIFDAVERVVERKISTSDSSLTTDERANDDINSDQVR